MLEMAITPKSDNFFVPAGTADISAAFQRREETKPSSRPGGTLESLPEAAQASLQDANPLPDFPGNELPGYCQTVPNGTKTTSTSTHFHHRFAGFVLPPVESGRANTNSVEPF